MMGAIDDKRRDGAVYLTYDEKAVRQATIDHAVQILGSTSYQTYDERAISRIEIVRGIRAAPRRRRLLVLYRTAAIVLAAVLGFVLMMWIGSTRAHQAPAASTHGGRHVGSMLEPTAVAALFHGLGVSLALIVGIPLLLLVGIICWGPRWARC